MTRHMGRKRRAWGEHRQSRTAPPTSGAPARQPTPPGARLGSPPPPPPSPPSEVIGQSNHLQRRPLGARGHRPGRCRDRRAHRASPRRRQRRVALLAYTDRGCVLGSDVLITVRSVARPIGRRRPCTCGATACRRARDGGGGGGTRRRASRPHGACGGRSRAGAPPSDHLKAAMHAAAA